MSAGRLAAGHRPTEDGAEVLAPGVGWWIDPPADGTIVGPGSRIGSLMRLGRRFDIVLDRGPLGRVERAPPHRAAPVAYGDVLFRIVRVAADAADATGGAGERVDADGRGAGTHAVVAPSHGVFYRRPSPEALPFVEVGAAVASGQPIGLVEIMKTFNRVVYGGPGLPEHATVVAIRFEDGAEVNVGETLMVVRSR